MSGADSVANASSSADAPNRIALLSQRVFTPEGDMPAAVLIDGETITGVVRPRKVPKGYAVVDVGTFAVIPGLVDTNVQLAPPGPLDASTVRTTTAAAIAGGVTTVLDWPGPATPIIDSAVALEDRRQACDGAIHCDVGHWAAVTPQTTTPQIDAMITAGALGFAAALSDHNPIGIPPCRYEDLRHIMTALSHAGMPLAAFAAMVQRHKIGKPPDDIEPMTTWLTDHPDHFELDGINYLIDLCELTHCHVHVASLSSGVPLAVLYEAFSYGFPISVETCPHNLHFTADELPGDEAAYKANPPIRGTLHRSALWEALRSGQIDLIGSGHSPIPRGVGPSFETAEAGIATLPLTLPIVWTDARRRHLSLEDVLDWLCGAPARLAGIDERKGRLEEGMDADIVVFDDTGVTDVTRDLVGGGRSPYLGEELDGCVMQTWLRGRCVFSDGEVVGEPAGVCLRPTSMDTA